MKKIQVFIATLLALSMIALAGCGAGNSGTDGATQSAGPGESQAGKDSITIAQNADPKSLDPYGTTDAPAGRVMAQIFDTLVSRDTDGNIVPGLAESWDIVDDNTYVFHLRKDVKFHNGEDFKASDVEFSFKQIEASPHASSVRASIDFDNSKALDDYTFEMKMSEPFGPILNHLCHSVMSIVSEKAYTELGETFGQNPVGTGPFKFVSWQTGDRIDLVAFEDYWGTTAQIKNVAFRSIPEIASRSIEVETGGVDIAINVQASELPRLESNPNIIIHRRDASSTNFLAFTCNKAPMDNVKFRQAINMGINKQAILEVVYQNTGKVATGPMSPNIWAFNENLPQVEYNPAKAKELLAEAGYPDGVKISITSNEDQTRLDIAEMVQAQLGEIGVEVEIITLEWGAFIEKVYVGGMEMFGLGWSSETGDPDYALYASFHSSMQGEGGNMSFYSNPEVDKLLDQGRNSTDENVRKEAYAKAQEIIWEEVPCVFLQNPEDLYAYNANIQNFSMTSDGHLNLNEFTFA